MNKKTIAVVFGSRSAEHDVSIVTAINAVIEPLEVQAEYDVLPVYIAKNGTWYSDQKLKDINFYAQGDLDKKLSQLKPIELRFEDGLWLVKPGFGGGKTKIDVVFPATHGTYGEDGSLMGLLRMANVPFVGCDLFASAVAMDKVLTKMVVEHQGLPTPKFVWFTQADYHDDPKACLARAKGLKTPLFVKPTHLGSSIAISRVEKQTDLANAVEVALHYDHAVLIEEQVNNLKEVTVPVIGNEHPRAALVEAALNKSADFFDFDTKYMQQNKGKAKTSKSSYSELPAELPKALYEQAEATALAAYRAIQAEGTARIDLLIDMKTKKVYVNEINPLPGSLYKHNWQAAGVSPRQLTEELIELAEDRHAKQAQTQTVFDTNYLQQF